MKICECYKEIAAKFGKRKNLEQDVDRGTHQQYRKRAISTNSSFLRNIFATQKTETSKN